MKTYCLANSFFMKILDGKKLAEKILEKLKKEIKKKRLKLKLAVVLVGNDLPSKIYIRKKKEACEKIGVGFELLKFSSRINKAELEKEIKRVVGNPVNTGVVIQLPLPKGFNHQEFLNLVLPEKDVDVLSEKSIGKLYTGSLPIFPPAAEGIRRLLKEYKIPIRGKSIVLIGAGRLIGRPLALWLSKEKVTVIVANKFTKNVSYFTKKADIIISGVGSPNLITGKMVREGAVVIDAGTFRKGKKLVGDVEFKGISKKAGYITPVLGGVGPMTVACLLENLVKLKTTKLN